MKKGTTNLTAEQLAQIEALKRLPDDQINTDDIPEVREWTHFVRGAFYKPVKQQITLRLDADIVNWFKTHAKNGRGYQTDINTALRKHVYQSEGRRAARQDNPSAR